MAKFSLELSDGLEELAHQFDDYAHEARVLSPDDARALRERCRLLKRRARDLENEVSAGRWNRLGQSEDEWARENTRIVLEEVSRPDSNVALFPVIPRPFHDGARPRGGAA